jgi:hypothetical protein
MNRGTLAMPTTLYAVGITLRTISTVGNNLMYHSNSLTT